MLSLLKFGPLFTRYVYFFVFQLHIYILNILIYFHIETEVRGGSRTRSVLKRFQLFFIFLICSRYCINFIGEKIKLLEKNIDIY